jgi:hypothetical protein
LIVKSVTVHSVPEAGGVREEYLRKNVLKEANDAFEKLLTVPWVDDDDFAGSESVAVLPPDPHFQHEQKFEGLVCRNRGGALSKCVRLQVSSIAMSLKIDGGVLHT